MNTHTITIRFTPSDVAYGLARQVARTIIRTLHIIEGEGVTTEEDYGFVVTFRVLASGRAEALRTARAVEGALSPLTTSVTTEVRTQHHPTPKGA